MSYFFIVFTFFAWLKNTDAKGLKMQTSGLEPLYYIYFTITDKFNTDNW